MSTFKLLGLVLAIGTMCLVLFFVRAVVQHNLRIRRLRELVDRLPPEIREQVLGLIDRAGRPRPAALALLRAAPPATDREMLLDSHHGGLPYAVAGDAWPTLELTVGGDEDRDSGPAPFLLQVRLAAPDLPDVWKGRLVAVFMRHDPRQTVRSYDAPSRERYVPLAGGARPPPPELLRAIALPELSLPADEPAPEADDPTATWWDRFRLPALIAAVPGLRELLERHTTDTTGLLSQLLVPGMYGYEVDATDLLVEGGRPSLIQGEHDARCDTCSKPMRFLFQFGALSPAMDLGDSVIYIYGCDAHPERPLGLIDFT